jgi:hypothetical protein
MYSQNDNCFRYKYSCYLLQFRYRLSSRGAIDILHWLGIWVIWNITPADEMVDFLYQGKKLIEDRNKRLAQRQAYLNTVIPKR